MVIWSIRQSSCSRRPQRNAAGPWSLFLSHGEGEYGEVVDPDQAEPEGVAPEMLQLLRQLNIAPGPVVDDKTFGVLDTDGQTLNTTCPYHKPESFTPVMRRGRFEIATGLGAGKTPRLVSQRVAEERAPRLCEVLHQHYGTNPAPEPPPVPTAEEQAEERHRAARARRRKEECERRERAVDQIVALLDDRQLAPRDRIGRLLDIAREYVGGH